jgi:hypothetical protein
MLIDSASQFQDILSWRWAVKRQRLRLGRIEDELRDVQSHFVAINGMLTCPRRDDFTESERRNLTRFHALADLESRLWQREQTKGRC